MRIDQFTIKENQLNFTLQKIEDSQLAQLVLVYTSRKNLESPTWLSLLKSAYPKASVVSCTTSGEIYEMELLEDSVSGVAIELEKSKVELSMLNLSEAENSFEAGKAIINNLKQEDLRHIMVNCDGWLVNGSELIEGMYSQLNESVTISGGMAGDGVNFSNTLVGINEKIGQGNIVAMAFYGDQFQVGYGNHGGWDVYSKQMQITQCKGRLIEEIDKQPALELYKQFIGSEAEGLPGTALKYPIGIYKKTDRAPLVRSIYNVDELKQGLLIGEAAKLGDKICFIKAEFGNIIEGVKDAAYHANQTLKVPAELAIVVSCIGRKMLFGQDVEKEVEISKNQLGKSTPVIGFYSNGEICTSKRKYAELHHQMVTITTFSELSY